MKKSFTMAALCLAANSAPADSWEFSVSPYLWLPSISIDGANTRAPGSPLDGARVEITPSSYLDALDFGLMLAGAMRKDDWIVKGDFIYLDFSIDGADIDFLRPGLGPVAGTYRAGLSGTVITLTGGNTFFRSASHLAEALIGWRRLGMSLDISGDLQTGGSVALESDLDSNDALIGINGRYSLGDEACWSLNYYADIGAGESDLTWQVVFGLGYGFRWGELFVNYRHLDYELGEVDEFNDLQLVFSGPSMGATVRF